MQSTVSFRVDPYSDNAGPTILVDAAIVEAARSGKLGKGWETTGAVAFARRAMEIAVISAQTAGHQRLATEYAEEWQELSKRAKRAADSLAELMNYMSVRKPGLIGPLSPGHLEPLTNRLILHEDPAANPKDERRLGRELASNLASGLGAATRVAVTAQRRQKKIKTSIQNLGEIEKSAFAKVWAEAWLSLYWKRPSSSRGDTNAFTAFLSVAWEDATGCTDESFAASVRSAIADLPREITHWWLPSWT